MLVEYLFEIPPLTTILLSLSLLIFLYKTKLRSKPSHSQPSPIPSTYLQIKPPSLQDPTQPTISILSYNIMSYSFTKTEWFPYVKTEYLYPKYRSPRIINEIETINADILCLQECDSDLFNDYYKKILEHELHYICIMHPSSYVYRNRKAVVNTVCYKKHLFTELNSTLLDLNDELCKIDESFTKHKEALIVQLEHKANKEKFIVISTHLYWNPEYEYVRYGEIARIVSYVYKKYKECALFICGDLNASPYSNVLRYIYGEEPDVDETSNKTIKGDFAKNKKYIELIYNNEQYKNHYLLRSAYDVYKAVLDGGNSDTTTCKRDNYNINHPDFTCYTNEVMANYDYIIYSPKHYELIELLKMPVDDGLIRKDRLPNKNYASDHLKVYAKFGSKLYN